jgi:hypothetical protein
LKDFLERNDPPWKMRVVMAMDIAVALNFMHKKGLVYRYQVTTTFDAKLLPLALSAHTRLPRSQRHQAREPAAHRERSHQSVRSGTQLALVSLALRGASFEF